MCVDFDVNGKSFRIDSIRWLNTEAMKFQKQTLTLNKKTMLVIFGTKRVGNPSLPLQTW